MTWTDELYRLHDIPLDADLDLDGIVERYHPDDRERIGELMDRAITAGESYDMEVRLQTAPDRTRWVRAIGEPVREDGEVVRIQGSIQDITAQKEHEQALRSLNEATRGLLGAETEADVADIVVDAAADVLDTGGVVLYLLDSESNRLEPAAYSDGFTAPSGGAPSVGAGDGDSLLWNCFVTGTPTVFDDTDALAHSKLLGPDVGGGLLFPLGDHGVFVVATTATTVDTGTRQLAETLVATTETGLDRLENEASLRERDAELEARNERLQRQVQITDIIRGIDRSLIQANSREEIEQAVCRQLVEAADVAFAWIGAVDGGGETLVPSAWAGTGDEYLDAVSFETDVEAPEPAAATVTSEQPTIVGNVVDDMKREPWRKRALASDFHSVLSVPLTYEGYFYGVLAVYADEPDVFDDLERTVFAELGTNIANSINAIETRRALHADTLVELSLVVDPADTFHGRIATAADCQIEYEGLVTHTDGESRLFFAATGSDPDSIEAVLDDLVSVQDYRLVDESEERLLFEVTVSGAVLPARLVRHGASPRSIRVTDAGMEVVVDVPTKTDVREFFGMVRDIAPSVELVGKRTVERATQTRQELVSDLFDTLTERQLEVLRTAYFAGFFDWPRTSTGEDVAEMLDVTQPTVNRHLRFAQQRLLEQLLDDSTPTAPAD
jgi:predicted DNA binding protein